MRIKTDCCSWATILGGVLPLVVKAYVSMAECHLTSLGRILRFFSAPFDNNSFVICIYGFKGTTGNLVAFRWPVNSGASRTLEEIKWRKKERAPLMALSIISRNYYVTNISHSVTVGNQSITLWLVGTGFASTYLL